jgi:hypothetical protein
MSVHLPRQTATEKIRRALLREALVDWVNLHEVDYFVRVSVPAQDPAAVVEIGLKVVRQLASEGLIRLGEIADTGYQAWHGPLEVDLERIRQGWRSGERGAWGNFVWLSLTDAGKELAEGLRSSRQGSDE